VGQEPLRSERRWSQDIERQADTFDGAEDLFDAAARDTFPSPDRFNSDSQALPDRVGPARSRALGMTLDLTDEVGRNPGRHPLQSGLGVRLFRLRCGRGTTPA
jgi:hypothetical protein